jgi:hypothetical protein
MNIRRIIYSEFGKYIISILLGLGLASLFRRACHDKTCYRFVGPNVNEIKDKVFKFNDKCYKYKPNAQTCNKEKKQVHFE